MNGIDIVFAGIDTDTRQCGFTMLLNDGTLFWIDTDPYTVKTMNQVYGICNDFQAFKARFPEHFPA